jgi:hypothetical protein
MRIRHLPILIGLSSFLCTSCVSVTPVLNSYEKAGTLGSGNAEAAVSYTGYNTSAYERSAHSHNNYGFRAGYGLSDRFDLKVRYERFASVLSGGERAPATNYFSLIPKVALVPRHLSLSVPISRYTYNEVIEAKTYSREVNSIASQVHFTYTAPGNKVDLTGGLKADFVYGQRGSQSEHDLLLSTSVGAGFSTNVDQWAIRPEVGFLYSAANVTTYVTYGVGVQYTLFGRRQHHR